MSVQKYYPVQGTNKFQTVSFPMVKAFSIDFGAQAVGTDTTAQFPKGAMILGFIARVTEAASSAGGTATLQIGFSGTSMLSSAIAESSLTDGAVFGANGSAPIVLSDYDTFDSIVGTEAFTSGKIDVFVLYVPLPSESLDSDNFAEYTTA